MGKAPKVRVWLVMLVVILLSLAACMPEGTPAAPAEPNTAATSEATEEPAGEVTEGVTAGATEEATAEATEEASEEPTDEERLEEEATEEPAAETADTNEDIGLLVSQTLAQQLQVSPDQVEIVSVEAVEWPDACLGISSADMMCAQVITPGYKVIVAVDGREYEYHTNSDGSFVQLASAPEANIGEPLITWHQTLDTCQAAQFGRAGVAFGPCMGVMMGGKLVSPEREAEFTDLIATYAPFEAETPAGTITFAGEGSAMTRPSEQRMLAEWARQAALEASVGHSDAAWGLVLSWHREGGFAGFCNILNVYVTGQVNAATCREEPPAILAQRRMTPDELSQIYVWMDEYAPTNYHHDDGMAADSMVIDLAFSGVGNTEADEDVQQKILSFAESVYARLTS